MGLSQLHFLLFLIVLCIFLSKAVFGNLQKPNVLPQEIKKYRRFNLMSDTDKVCVCFDQDRRANTIADELDPLTEGLERLVIYLYKVTSTNEIHLYIPKYQNQIIFPDLNYAEGDMLMPVSNEPIGGLLNNNVNVIHINYPVNYHPSVGQNLQSPFKPYPTKTIIATGNNISQSPQPSEFNYPVELNQTSMPMPNKTNQFTSSPQTLSPLDLQTRFPEQLQPTQQTNINQTSTNFNIILSNDPHEYQNGAPIQEQPGKVISMSEKGIDTDKSKGAVTFNQWFTDQIKHMEDEKSLQANPINTVTLENLIQKILKQHNIFLSPTGLLTDSNGKLLDTSKLHLRPVLIGHSVEYRKIILKSNKTFIFPSDKPYLGSLVITLSNPSKVLGIIPLSKVFLPKTVNQETISLRGQMPITKDYLSLSGQPLNHYVNSPKQTSTGPCNSCQSNQPPLGNRNGGFLQQSSAFVQPAVHYGKKVTTYSNVKNAKKSKNVQSNLPYYKTQHQHVSKHKNAAKHVHFKGPNEMRNVAHTFEDFGNYGNRVPVDPFMNLLHNVIRSGRPQNVDNQSWTSQVVPPVQEEELLELLKSMRAYDGKDQSEVNSINDERLEDTRRGLSSSIGGLMNILSLFGRRKTKNDNSFISGEENDEEPGFRIIGGNAATGSGFPISNRGRSGLIKLH